MSAADATGPPVVGAMGAAPRRGVGLVAVVTVGLLAANLRPALASVAPVLHTIQRSTGLSSAAASLLTALPVLAFGVCAPLAPRLGRRFGMEPTLLVCLAVLTAGIAVRTLPSAVALFTGTVAAGVAIAVGNVLLPGLVKRDYAAHAGLMTGVYSGALSAGAGLAAGLTVPLQHATGLGWRPTLALWAAPAAVAAVVWLPVLAGPRHRAVGAARPWTALWGSGLAWQVTVFMGLQSFEFYALLAWLPSVFEQHGSSAATAGWLLSLAGFAGIPSSFVVPVLAARAHRQRRLVALSVGLCAAGTAGLVLAPTAAAPVWMVLLGLGQGAAISLALAFLVLRSADAEVAAELSGMAQCLGYVVAAAGPFLVGVLRDATGGWRVPLLVLLGLLAVELAAGVGAGRPRLVHPRGA